MVIGRSEAGALRPKVSLFGGSRCSFDCPDAFGGAADAEDGEAGEVVGGGEQVEVGVDFCASSDSCSSAAVAASHQVSEFAFDLGAGLTVVVSPLGIVRMSAAFSQESFVAADLDGPPPGRGCAVGPQRASRASRFEVGDAIAGFVSVGS
jgi:hypothetical protein